MSAVFWLLYCLSQFHMLYSAPIVTDAKSCNIDENCLPIDGKHGLLLAPAITAVKDALQHAKCYSLCVNEVYVHVLVCTRLLIHILCLILAYSNIDSASFQTY